MKRGVFLILLLLIFGTLTIEADYLGVKKPTETISFFLNEPLDTAGLPTLPDSAHIFTYGDNASAATFTTRSTTYPFSAVSIDTLKIYGDTIYVFADAIADIDGAGGNFELAIEVKLFGDGLPVSTHATVQVIADSLGAFLDDIRDSLQNQDDWVATAAILDDVIDSVRLIEGDVDDILDTLQSQDDWVATDAILDDVIDTLRLVEGDVDDILDTLQVYDDAARFQKDIQAVLDTLQNQDDWVATAAILDDVVDSVRLIEGDVDDILDSIQVYDDANRFQADIQDILDTLQNQDDWIATAGIVDDIVDTVRLIEGDVDDILDSIQVYDDAGHFQADIQDVLDTLQNQDDWVATAAILDDVVDSVRLIEGDVDDILDTLKNYDDWIATAAILDDVIDSVRLIEGDVDDILDTLKSQDDWVSSFDASSDCVVPQDTLCTGDSVAVMPDFWSAADTAGYQGAAAGLTKANIADTVWSHAGRDVVIEDTLTTGDSVGVMPDFWSAADSTAFQGDVSAVADVADTVNAIIDSLQNQDDWVATAAILDDVIDSVRLIEGDVDDILDTLKSQDDWIATDAILDDVIDTLRLVEADVDNVVDTVNAIVDSLQHADTYKADVSAMLTKANVADTVNVVTRAAVDTLAFYLGAKIGGYFYTQLDAGADSVWVVTPGDDTLAVFIFLHPGGAAGDPPDSLKVVAP